MEKMIPYSNILKNSKKKKGLIIVQTDKVVISFDEDDCEVDIKLRGKKL